MLSKTQEDLVLLLASNLDLNKMHFGGSICDYIIFNELKVNVNINVNDIDICVYDIKVLNEIEKIVNQKLFHVDSVDNDFFKHKQYIIKYKTCKLDIFLRDNDLMVQKTIFKGYPISYTGLDSRYEILKRAILNEYTRIPAHRPNNSMFKSSERCLKYIKKLMIYNHIKNGK